ncbi:antitermination protein [Escherichia coli]|uniref:antitermination protein n=1 Tax=Escherichia coli TaxID=562 RepID=UPI002882E1DE|nr:antitermination protein [Escherichia coli]
MTITDEFRIASGYGSVMVLVNRPILSLNRKPKSRVESALNPIDLTVLAEYHEQIESNLQRIERKNQRTWYSKPGERGITCSGRQKIKGKSIPLT